MMMMLCVHSTTTDFVTRDSLLMHPKYVHQKKKKSKLWGFYQKFFDVSSRPQSLHKKLI